MTADVAGKGWFSIKSIAPDTWGMENASFVNCYLLSGSKRALLVDTGMGLGDLASFVRTLTSLPLDVVNTHYHFDHTGGNGQFPRIHVHPADAGRLNRPRLPDALQRRAWETFVWLVRFLRRPIPVFLRGLPLQRRMPPGEIVPIPDGFVFDLGGRQIEVIATPGHTPGSVCLLDRRERILFAADTVIGRILMHFADSTPLAEFHLSLLRLQSRRPEFDRIFAGHNMETWSPRALDELTAGVGRILAGEITGTWQCIEIGAGLFCTLGEIGLLYDGDKLHRTGSGRGGGMSPS